MITRDDIDKVRGGTAYDEDGSKLGKVGEVYLDNDSGEPAWVTVSTGLFGTRQSFVPLDGANLDGDDLRLPHSKSTVKDAPNIGDDESLTPEAEDELYRHYGVGGPQGGHDGDRRDRDQHDGDRDGVRDAHDGDRDRDGVQDRDRDGDHGGGRTAAAAGAAGVAGVAGGAAARGRGDHDDRDHGDRDHDRRDGRDESVVDRVRDRADGDRDHDRDTDRDRDRGVSDGGRRGSSGPRLRKHTVTEMQTITVPVEKEVYTLEDDDGRPVDDVQRDSSGVETGKHGRGDEQR